MSYGYLVASTSPIPELQKHRRFKFSLIESSGDFYAYSRLEESNELTTRQHEKSIFTSAGREFFASIRKSFFLVDFLLTKNQSEADVVKAVKSNLNSHSFKNIRIISGKELSLNCPYEVSHD